MEKGFLIFLIIFFLLHILRTVYSVLKYRNKISSKSRPVFISTLFVMIAMWIIWFRMCEIESGGIIIPGYLKLSGFILVIIGVFLFVVSLVQLRGVENISRLVTNGLYSKIRHPMYLAMISWIIGYPLFQEAKYTLFTSLFWIANILIWRYLEEKELIEKYDEYLIYKKRTFF